MSTAGTATNGGWADTSHTDATSWDQETSWAEIFEIAKGGG